MKNIILLYTFFFTSIILLSSCTDKKTNDQVNEQTAESLSDSEEVKDELKKNNQPKVDQQKLNSEIKPDTILGRWLRPDGNYVIQINSIDKNNKIDAQYFNPSPIKIAHAELIPDNNYRIFIEFDDEGYKGSTYDLIYDPVNDALAGKYFQATYGQTYQIAFIRLKE